MKKDKVKLYFIEIIILIILFIALFVSTNVSRIALSILLLFFAILINSIFKKKKHVMFSSKEVSILMTFLALIYVLGFYILGILFYSFNKQMVLFSVSTLFNFIIPFVIIIISSEMIRFILLSQDGKIRIRGSNIDYSKFLLFLIMFLIDLIIYVNVYNIYDLNEFLALIGFVSFASISCNLFYNYYSKRFGIKGIIFYRVITILYVYIIPIVPNMYIYFRTFLRMLYPYLMYLLLENTFGKSSFVETYSNKRKNVIVITSLIVIMTFITMLISCQFKYGVLVVGSESMTGALNKGDATIFVKYSGQKLRTGDIIIFNYSDVKLVHRIVDIVSVNGETRYYTKGDMNSSYDPEYRLENDIVGISKLNVRYIGIPTLWLHELFN